METLKKLFARRFLLVPVFAIVFMLASYSPAEAGEHGHGHDAGEHGHAGPHWGYEGSAGPAHWGDLSADFSACRDGKSQSPINVTHAKSAKLDDIVFNYDTSKLSIVNNGHTIQANYDSGSSIEINGKRFNLLQFHFHGPSEHTVNSRHFPMEMHMVHKSNDGALAVVGVMIKEGAHNSAFDNAWANLPAHSGDHKNVGVLVKADELLPKSKKYTTYSGSLTTPPCSEGVTWLVMNDPIELSKKQIEAFGHIIHDNNRPIQSLNKRDLKVAN